MSIDKLVELILRPRKPEWAKKHQEILEGFFGAGKGRYPADAKKSAKLRAPEDIDVPYAAYIHPMNPDSGAYGGTSLVFFPPEGWERPCLIGMVVGTQGLSPDEGVLSRPGHARKTRAICAWLNRRQRGSAWAKQDPTRIDLNLPSEVASRWPEMKAALNRYGREIYAVFRPASSEDVELTRDAVLAFLDLLMEERGYPVLRAGSESTERIRSQWFAHILYTGGMLRCGRTGKTQVPLRWDPPSAGTQLSLVPDFVLEAPDFTLVADAKYKRHLEEFATYSRHEVAEKTRESHRADVHQVLAYCSLFWSKRNVALLVYPCRKETWDSLKRRRLLIQKAAVPAKGRSCELWLSVLPMEARVEEAAKPLIDALRELRSEAA